MSEKMRYHLTITDNQSGEVIKDVDFCALIGGLYDENGTAEYAVVDCDDFKLGMTLMAASVMAEKGLRRLPKEIAEGVVKLARDILDGKYEVGKENSHEE